MNRHRQSDPEALLFDVGNVLITVDFERVLAQWAGQARADVDSLRERFVVSPEYEQHERGEIDAKAFFESLRQALDIDLSDDHFLEGWNAIFVDEVSGIRSLLERACRRLPTYALSNTNAVHYAVFSRRFSELFNNFSGVFTSCELGRRKPEPEAYLTVARQMGVGPDRVLFFDDSLENVEGARRLGMPSVLVNSIDDINRSLSPIL